MNGQLRDIARGKGNALVTPIRSHLKASLVLGIRDVYESGWKLLSWTIEHVVDSLDVDSTVAHSDAIKATKVSTPHTTAYGDNKTAGDAKKPTLFDS